LQNYSTSLFFDKCPATSETHSLSLHDALPILGPDTGRSPDYRDLFYRYCESKTALCIGFDFDWAQKGQRVYFLRNGCAGYLANRYHNAQKPWKVRRRKTTQVNA